MRHAKEATQFASETLVVVGVGLLGGSIAAAVRSGSLASRVVGVGRNEKRLESARDRGLIDIGVTDVGQLDNSPDFAIICTPTSDIVDKTRAVARQCRPGMLITDVGSVKASICAQLVDGLPTGVEFIGSHPLAGSEKSGFEHASANLFQGCITVVTPMPAASDAAIGRLNAFWHALGANVIDMTPEEHDHALARTSHVPHVIAAALAAELSKENRHLAATGFRDTTRIAAGDPRLWVSILLDNADSVLQALDQFNERVGQFRNALERRDADGLRELLQLAKDNRDALS